MTMIKCIEPNIFFQYNLSDQWIEIDKYIQYLNEKIWMWNLEKKNAFITDKKRKTIFPLFPYNWRNIYIHGFGYVHRIRIHTVVVGKNRIWIWNLKNWNIFYFIIITLLIIIYWKLFILFQTFYYSSIEIIDNQN